MIQWDIHDFVTKREELLRRKGFSEEVGKILIRLYIRHCQFAILNSFSNEEVTTIDVLRTLMMFWIIS